MLCKNINLIFTEKIFSLGAGENFEKNYYYGGKNQWIFKFLYKSVDFLFQKLYIKSLFFSALAWYTLEQIAM
jgi:hypothetical protein